MDTLIVRLREALSALPDWAAVAVGAALLIAAAVVADLVLNLLLQRWLHGLTRRTRTTWDDKLVEHKVFARVSHVAPALVFYFGITLVPNASEIAIAVVRNVAMAYMIVMVTLAVVAALSAANATYETYPVSKERPIKGFVQIGQILVFVVGGMLMVSALVDRSPVVLLTGLGAMTAVLLLIFRDTILSLVASIQITSMDMVRVGDWIEMPEYDADGDVIDVSLHTVRVQNWDKTITTIPTYKLISDSFRNWRGMQQSGGRRIKRSVHIDQSTVRHLTDEELERFKRFVLLKDYIAGKERELREYNEGLDEAVRADVNMRRLTNVGTFRAYVFNYLKNHPKIHKDMTLLVRQLPPGPTGLPIEIYAFTSTTAWAEYEGIQADIFDHVLTVIPEFGLKVFQQPAGADVQALVRVKPGDRGEAIDRSGNDDGGSDAGGAEAAARTASD